MAREHINKKHKAIKDEYKQMFDKGFRHEVIATKLAEKYFMSKVSLENLVWGTGGYGKYEKKSDPAQTNLFDL